LFEHAPVEQTPTTGAGVAGTAAGAGVAGTAAGAGVAGTATGVGVGVVAGAGPPEQSYAGESTLFWFDSGTPTTSMKLMAPLSSWFKT
jgi:hypothetical protein